MVRIAIVEDEDIFAQNLETLLTAYAREKNVDISCIRFRNAVKLLTDFKINFEIVFMDINLPEIDGMKAAEKLRKIDQNVLIVFATNMPQYAVQGYSVNALDFIVKPVSAFAVNTLMDKALRKINAETTHLFSIKTKDGFRRVHISSIQYIEVWRKCMIYHTDEGDIQSWGSINAVEKILPSDSFFRCNNCYLINLSYVKAVEGDYVTVLNNKLKIARLRKKDFLTKLACFFGKM